MNEAEVIKGAREMLSDPEKWGKGAAMPTPTSSCLVHALSLSINSRSGGLPDEGGLPDLKAVCKLLEQYTPCGVPPSIYNDDPGTKHQDILDLLDKVLADLGAA